MGSTTAGNSAYAVSIVSNVVVTYGQSGISLSAGTSNDQLVIADFVIGGNIVQNCTGNGIQVQRCSYGVIADNTVRIRAPPTAAPTGGPTSAALPTSIPRQHVS